MHEWYPGVFQTKASTKAFVKYHSGHFSAHNRAVLISSIIVAKQHLLSTGKTRCFKSVQITDLSPTFKKVEDLTLAEVSWHFTNVTALRIIWMCLVKWDMKVTTVRQTCWEKENASKESKQTVFKKVNYHTGCVPVSVRAFISFQQRLQLIQSQKHK